MGRSRAIHYMCCVLACGTTLRSRTGLVRPPVSAQYHNASYPYYVLHSRRKDTSLLSYLRWACPVVDYTYGQVGTPSVLPSLSYLPYSFPLSVMKLGNTSQHKPSIIWQPVLDTEYALHVHSPRAHCSCRPGVGTHPRGHPGRTAACARLKRDKTPRDEEEPAVDSPLCQSCCCCCCGCRALSCPCG